MFGFFRRNQALLRKVGNVGKSARQFSDISILLNLGGSDSVISSIVDTVMRGKSYVVLHS